MLLIQSSLLLKARDVAVELFQIGLHNFESPLDFVEAPACIPTLPDNHYDVHHHAKDDRKHWYADCKIQLLVGHLIYPH
jgi:hypothetical protein